MAAAKKPVDYCLVLLTDALYLPGTLVAAETWIRHNGRCPIVVMSRDASLALRLELKRLGARFEWIDDTLFREIPTYKKRRSRRYAETFFKFHAFSDFGYERNVFLDSDILCLRPAPRLTDNSDSQLLAALDTGFRRTRGYKGHASEINSGVLGIDASIQGESTVRALVALARTSPGRGGYNAGDQAVLNKWVHREGIALELLDADYNLLKKNYSDHSGVETCRLLHFADRKPWFPQPESRTPESLERLWSECVTATAFPLRVVEPRLVFTHEVRQPDP